LLKAHQETPGRGLAASALPDQAQRFALLNIEGYAVDRPDRADLPFPDDALAGILSNRVHRYSVFL
jgi:hypothetical protein